MFKDQIPIECPGEADPFSKTLAMVAHDLRGPLANLTILNEDIERQARLSRHAGIAGKSARAEEIIRQLTAMLSALVRRARDSRDPPACNPAPVNLVDVLDLAVSVNQPLARRKSVRFRCHAIDPCIVPGDAELLFEAFDNLIRNAIRHTGDHTTVVCEIAPADDRTVSVRISDEGPGFSIADLARLFRPFTHLSGGPHPQDSAGGLGLWITRLIAERHGGHIDAGNRTDGKGASLTIRLPAEPEQKADAGPGARVVPPSAEPPGRRRKAMPDRVLEPV